MPLPTFAACTEVQRARLRVLRGKVEPILAIRVHRHFTDHSVDHSDRVASLAEQLAANLPDDKKLTPDEAFILYGACYTHDIGMHNERAGRFGRLKIELARSDTKWSDLSDVQKLDLLRDHHHEVSADMIVASRDMIGAGYAAPPIGLALDDDDHPDEMAAVVESHAVDADDARYAELVGPTTGTRRLRLLSAVLRLADILDEAQHRALRSQSECLDLSNETSVHWWRHYYTRQVLIDSGSNLVTIVFQFPIDSEGQLESVVPELQMPWIRREFDRHRAVLAENGLGWTVRHTINRPAFSTLDAAPASVVGLMLQSVARQRAVAASESEQAVRTFEDRARDFGNQQVDALNKARDGRDAGEYLTEMLAAAIDLSDSGGNLSAIAHLRSAVFFSTTNGRSVPSRLHVRAVTDLGRLLMERGDGLEAVQELARVEKAAASLPDTEQGKAAYFRHYATALITAGSFTVGWQAAETALKLLLPGSVRNQLQAEVDEATMLEGLSPSEAGDA